MKASLSALALLTSTPLVFGNNAELAQALSNPVADLISVPIQSNVDFGIGPGGGTKWTTNVQPVIPFGIIGALLGHFVFGIPVSILSVFGLLALSGIVVNDSLVLVHRVDELRAEGLSLPDALHDAGGQRFRAILLTTLTTFVGLVPLLAEPAVQAQFLKPMAVSVGFGVVFATFITLVLLPMLMLISHDFRSRFSRSTKAWKATLSSDATGS